MNASRARRREPPLRRALRYAHPHRLGAAVIGALTLLVGATHAVEPLIHKHLFDALESGAVLAGITAGLTLLALLALGREIASGFANWLTWRIRLRIHFALLGEVVDRLQLLPSSYHKKEGVGAIMTRLERGIQGFVGAVGEIIFNTLPSLAYLVVAVFSMHALSSSLLILVAVMGPLPAIIAFLAAPNQTRRERQLLDRWSKIYARLHEVLSGLVTVRSFAREEAEKRRFLSRVAAANRIVERGVGFDSRVGALQNLSGAVARVGVIGLGAYLLTQGQITLGTIVAFLGYVGGLFGPIQALAGVYATVRRASVAMEEVFAILDKQDHVIEHAGAQKLEGVRGEVRFEDVHFGYEPDTLALAGLDLTVQPGEHLAIVGPSGSGKSTMMTLLQRFYDPTKGRITIDGKDLADLQRKSLREHIAVVLQDPILFNDTVAANIAYGRPGASRADIEEAARAAKAHDFITQLPKGYETLVGERGDLLSMGQRQRISIARALLKDAPIVVLDEATSALDAESEAAVQQAIARLVEGRTTFTIAHRLATVVDADRIVVLRDGSISEEGSHQQLMKRGGYYQSLVSQQTRGLMAA